MVVILAITAAVLLGVIVFQIALMARERQRHEQKMAALRQVVAGLVQSNAAYEQQLRISEELRQKLRAANNAISHDIAVLVKDFVEALSKNDLIE